MRSFLQWLNANAGGLTAATTIILAVLTGVYIRQNGKIIAAMREQLHLALRIHEQDRRDLQGVAAVRGECAARAWRAAAKCHRGVAVSKAGRRCAAPRGALDVRLPSVPLGKIADVTSRRRRRDTLRGRAGRRRKPVLGCRHGLRCRADVGGGRPGPNRSSSARSCDRIAGERRFRRRDSHAARWRGDTPRTRRRTPSGRIHMKSDSCGCRIRQRSA